MQHREHSIFFGDYNTWDVWHIVPSSRPTPTIPEAVTNFVEVPGRSGSLDLSETLTGHPVYGNRQISASFILYDQNRNWMSIYEDMVNKLHGRRMKIRLIDDPDWYYIGRVSVSNFASNSDYSSVDIECECEPYKYSDVIFEDIATFKLSDLITSNLQLYFTEHSVPEEGEINIPTTLSDGSVFFTKDAPVKHRTNSIFEPTFYFESTNTAVIDTLPYMFINTDFSTNHTMGMGYFTHGFTESGLIFSNEKGRGLTQNVLVLSSPLADDFDIETSDWDDDTDYLMLKMTWIEKRL